MTKTQLLGQILIERKAVTSEQVKQAVETQRTNKGYIGEMLVKLGYANDMDIIAALVVQCNLPYIAIDKYDIDSDVVRMIPREMASRNWVVPLEKVGDILSVVMADPLNLSLREELKEVTDCRISPFIASKKEIDRAIERVYNSN
ncbi:MAG: hypothetical protein HQL27_08630 [Candidatus Omnitrophica bacterium]|nr:hypothetical protein [Candidatus Omnitrophota bacterium]